MYRCVRVEKGRIGIEIKGSDRSRNKKYLMFGLVGVDLHICRCIRD